MNTWAGAVSGAGSGTAGAVPGTTSGATEVAPAASSAAEAQQAQQAQQAHQAQQVNEEGGNVEYRCELPMETQEFLLNLYEVLYSRDLARVKQLYLVDFPRVSESLYSNTPWPTLEEAEQFFIEHNRKHQLILALYQELWCRHFFSYVAASNPDLISWHHRLQSWRNYTMVLDFFAFSQCTDDPSKTRLAIPPEWLWDMLESFCEQFQECQEAKWRLLESGGTEGSGEDELGSLEELWNSKFVYSILHTFVAISGIVESLATGGLECLNQPDSDFSMKAPIGYFACISLLKLNVGSASYGSALEAVRPLLSLQLWPGIPPTCRVVYYYNLALARFMGREYKLATKYACTLYVHNLKLRDQLLTTNATKADPNSNSNSKSDSDANPSGPEASHASGPGSGSSVSPRMAHRMVHQCANLLLLCHLIAPEVTIDPFILGGVKDHLQADAARVLGGNADVAAVTEIFRRSLPRMCSSAVWSPTMDSLMVPMQLEAELIERQVTLFEAEYRTHQQHDQLLTLTKLYHNVSLQKLAVLSGLVTDETPEDQKQAHIDYLRSQIMFLQATYAHHGDVVCKLDKDIVHVTASKPAEVLTDQFRRHTVKIQELIAAVNAITVTPRIPEPTQPAPGTLQAPRGAYAGRSYASAGKTTPAPRA